MNILDVFVKKAAMAFSPVFLYGGTHADRENLAKLIHDGLKCKGIKFLSVDVSVIPVSLMDKVLFGKKLQTLTVLGLLEKVNNVTLFIDGVDRLPYVLQIKLMDFLNIGRDNLTKVNADFCNFMIIFGSACNPKSLSAEMRLDPSLLYNVCELKLCLDKL